MFLSKSLKKYLTAAISLLLASPVWAAGPPAENPLTNPLAILLFSIMIMLLIVIGIMGNILIGAADISLIKWKKTKEAEKKSVIRHAAARTDLADALDCSTSECWLPVFIRLRSVRLIQFIR